MRHKVREWSKRYIPAEIVATATALLAATIAYFLTNNYVITAICGTWGENIGYYGFIASRDVKKKIKKMGMLHAIKNTLKHMVLEFGFAEVLDSFVVRPFCMYIFPIVLGNIQLGIIVAKIIADIIFYIPTIMAYELGKKHLK